MVEWALILLLFGEETNDWEKINEPFGSQIVKRYKTYEDCTRTAGTLTGMHKNATVNCSGLQCPYIIEQPLYRCTPVPKQ